MASELPPPLTQEHVDAMDETSGHVISFPPERGSDLRGLVILPAFIAHGVSTGAMSLDIDGWDD